MDETILTQLKLCKQFDRNRHGNSTINNTIQSSRSNSDYLEELKTLLVEPSTLEAILIRRYKQTIKFDKSKHNHSKVGIT